MKLEIEVLVNGEIKLSEAVTEIKKWLPIIRMVEGSDSRVEEVAKMQKMIEEMQDEILTFTFTHESRKAEDPVEQTKSILQEAQDMEKETINLYESFKTVQKKVQAFTAAQ